MNDKIEGEPMSNPTGGESKEQKQARWDEMAVEVDKIVDPLDKHVDEGIKDTVIALQLLGFETDGSCEGHTDHGVCSPWIDITSAGIKATEPEKEKLFEKIEKQGYMDKETERRIDELNLERTKEQARVMGILAEFYWGRDAPYDTIIVVHPVINGRIQCIGTDIVELLPPEQKAVKLKQYQAEMAEFTKFLKDRYFNS